MELTFGTAKLAKVMNDDTKLSMKYGSVRAGQIRSRLDDLVSATTLDDMRWLPGKCEELRGNREGQLSIHLSANYRLIFEPANNPLPLRDDGGLDWVRVDSIRIIEVVDYH